MSKLRLPAMMLKSSQTYKKCLTADLAALGHKDLLRAHSLISIATRRRLCNSLHAALHLHVLHAVQPPELTKFKSGPLLFDSFG